MNSHSKKNTLKNIPFCLLRVYILELIFWKGLLSKNRMAYSGTLPTAVL